MMWVGVGIFLVTYALIASEKVDKTVAAMLGAAAMVIAGVAPFPEMLTKIDLNVLALLVGMMVIVGILATTGVFEWVAVVIARKSKGKALVVAGLFLLATAFISAFMDNVTTVILMAPVTILITQLLRMPTVPLLILEAVFSNIGGTATLIGDPPNILIGASCNLSFNAFLVNLAPVVVIICATSLVVVLWAMRKHLHSPQSAVEAVMLTDPPRAILEPKRLKGALAVFAVVLLGFFCSRLIGLDVGLIAIAGAFLMILVCKVDLNETLEKVEWGTILFFCGLFMMIGALELNGVFTHLGSAMVEMTAGNFMLTMMIILWGSAILSAVVDNIPLVIAMIPLIQSITPVFAAQLGLTEGSPEMAAQVSEPLFWSLALGACLGGNGTLIGASANVVVAQIARKNRYKLTFGAFTKYGLPIMLLNVLIASFYLYWRYGK